MELECIYRVGFKVQFRTFGIRVFRRSWSTRLQYRYFKVLNCSANTDSSRTPLEQDDLVILSLGQWGEDDFNNFNYYLLSTATDRMGDFTQFRTVHVPLSKFAYSMVRELCLFLFYFILWHELLQVNAMDLRLDLCSSIYNIQYAMSTSTRLKTFVRSLRKRLDQTESPKHNLDNDEDFLEYQEQLAEVVSKQVIFLSYRSIHQSWLLCLRLGWSARV